MINRPSVFGACVLLVAVISLSGQTGDRSRGLKGVVVDKRGNALKGAAVEIENTRDQAVASYLTRDDGKYYFHNLDPNTDYTVRAKYKRWWSKEKHLSKFNEKREVTIDLEIPVE